MPLKAISDLKSQTVSPTHSSTFSSSSSPSSGHKQSFRADRLSDEELSIIFWLWRISGCWGALWNAGSSACSILPVGLSHSLRLPFQWDVPALLQPLGAVPVWSGLPRDGYSLFHRSAQQSDKLHSKMQYVYLLCSNFYFSQFHDSHLGCKCKFYVETVT